MLTFLVGLVGVVGCASGSESTDTSSDESTTTTGVVGSGGAGGANTTGTSTATTGTSTATTGTSTATTGTSTGTTSTTTETSTGTTSTGTTSTATTGTTTETSTGTTTETSTGTSTGTTTTSGSGDACDGVTCTTPPDDACVDAATLRTYAQMGTCANGQCSYDPQDASCGAAKRCEGDACLACNDDLHCGDLCAACGGATPRCLGQGDTGSCVGCLSQGDCDLGESCDGATHTCVPSGGCSTTLAGVESALAQSAKWTHKKTDAVNVSWNFDYWQYGVATSGPGSCQAGGSCWATNLTGNYINCQRAELRTPSLDLAACAGISLKLVFWHWYDFWTGSYVGTTWFDGGLVELSGDAGATWVSADVTPAGTILINPNMTSSYACSSGNSFYVHNKPGYVGQSGAWEKVEVAIPPALLTTKLMVRFAYASGVSKQTTSQTPTATYVRPGWYLDGVAIEEQ